ncbi:hypothetical protein [Streptomyces sp. NPDC059010]|uniref:hypothetical protein n=1 Tax=Streptomyces sp. NPDC059010 TaxID=3346695 RepID=UPI0036AF75BB
MCDVYAIRTDLRVSVQVRAAASLVDGHRAVGVLVESDMVWVPDPPDVFLADSRSHAMEIVISPFPVREELLIERIRVPVITTYEREGNDRPALADLRLASRSRYAPQLREFSGADLARELEEKGGDMQLALVRIGAVSADAFDVESSLKQMSQIVNRQGIPDHKPKRPFATYAGLVDAACKVTCRCEPAA